MLSKFEVVGVLHNINKETGNIEVEVLPTPPVNNAFRIGFNLTPEVASQIADVVATSTLPIIAITGTIGPSNDGHILLIPESIQVHKMGSESNTLLN